MDTQPVEYMARTRAYYNAQGFEKSYAWATFADVPFTVPAKPLADSKLALITTAALYEREATDARYVAYASTSTPPDRLWANDLSWDKNATHMRDRGSYLPLAPLHRAVAEGRLGQLGQRFLCAPTDYSIRRTSEVDAPAILDLCVEDEIDVALFVPL